MRKQWLAISLTLVLIFILASCNLFSSDIPDEEPPSHEGELPDSTDPDDGIDQPIDEEPEPELIPDPVSIKITSVGDIMVHNIQITSQYNEATGDYDFRNNFQFIKPYIERADLALGNLETTFAGKERGYSGYPLFNAPDELAFALKDAGFDVISTSNNHTYDTGSQGVFRTLDILKENDLIPVGTRHSEEEESFAIVDVQGIKVGISAYTYETPRQGDNITLNGILVPNEMRNLIDSFSYEHLDEDLAKIKDRVDILKQRGAEVIIFKMHWGNEYHRQPNAYQERIAQELSNFGVDIIFGAHPHVLQKVDIIESEVDDRQTVVAYSLGNFISNQRYEFLNTRYTEDGMIVNVTVTNEYENNTISIDEVTYVPTWVHVYNKNNKRTYEILPVFDAMNNHAAFRVTGSSDGVWRLENSHQNTSEIIEGSTPVLKAAEELSEQEVAAIAQ